MDSKSDKQYTQIHTIASFEFINQNDKKITNKDFEGRFILQIFSLQPVLVFVQFYQKYGFASRNV